MSAKWDNQRLRVMADLGKLAEADIEVRKLYKDPQIRAEDHAAILHLASKFGVIRTHAYLRAKSLGLLSYQQNGMTEEEEEAWSDRINAWRFGGEDADLDAIYDASSDHGER